MAARSSQAQQQPTVPVSSLQQLVSQQPPMVQIPPHQPLGGEVYTMADLHNLAITQGRRLCFHRRWDANQSHPEHQ